MALFGDTRDNRGEIGTRLIRTAPSAVIVSPREVARRILAWLKRDAALRRSRRALLDLTDDQLRDIGVSRAAADREGRRSFYID